ncbi:histidine phosphatase family protein [Pseudaestuariivita sp.]|uniref:histidine phosphatase family protein n=1 Tax=Pseudaestuariivita sp. TaxID=2211669 RepID=UPI004058F8DD
MSELVLVRHGQANSGAKTEEEYDRLSPLGHDQSGWLGEWMRGAHMTFDHQVHGALRRHRETHAGMATGSAETDARLNEMQYFPMAEAMERHCGLAPPEDADAFADHVPPTMRAWQDGQLHGVPDTWEGFHGRIAAAVDAHCRTDQRVLMVTSGGVIASMIARVLDLEIPALTSVLLQTRNASMHSFRKFRGQWHLHQFNAVPHLETPDRAHALTFV